jgi:hypothetical protein
VQFAFCVLTLAAVLGFAPGGSPSTAADAAVPIPPKFYVPDSLESRFVDLWQRSPTFRGQCRIIAGAGVVVVIEIAPPAALVLRGVHAWSSIVKSERGLVRFARVRLANDGRWSLHLPHELEHIVEQIEGIDLDREARRSGQVWVVAGGAYETLRAKRVAEQVRRELDAKDRLAHRRGQDVMAERGIRPARSDARPAP